MKTKYVTVKVNYDTEETWDITLQEVEEIFQMMNNLKRNASIINIEQGINQDSSKLSLSFLNQDYSEKDMEEDYYDDGQN
tara:strand:+ start:2998 stop:3237 length:240 start_codon:yes stop_codon:yes gene_type:complete